MSLTRREYKYILSNTLQNFKDDLSAIFKQKQEEFLKQNDHKEMIACFEMYASVQDSINNAFTKLHKNF